MSSMERIEHPALTDSQTRLPNALHWETVFGIVFAAADRGIPLTLIILEIDHYLGWAQEREPEEVGRVLKALGAALRGTIRQSDLTARTEEGRFCFALLDCNLAGGRLVTDRLDSYLEPFRREGGMSFSIGVAAHHWDMKRPEDLVGAAEQAVRRAQSQGKNQIEFQE